MINQLKTLSFSTPIGPMLAAGSDDALWYLCFKREDEAEDQLEYFLKKAKAELVSGKSPALEQAKQELKAYFEGSLKTFKTPLHLCGTAFQQSVWKQLIKVPYGKTRSYAQQADAMNRPSAYRAVANANGANWVVIMVPCHRIIGSDGGLGGYSSGLYYKRWLLDHEQK